MRRCSRLGGPAAGTVEVVSAPSAAGFAVEATGSMMPSKPTSPDRRRAPAPHGRPAFRVSLTTIMVRTLRGATAQHLDTLVDAGILHRLLDAILALRRRRVGSRRGCAGNDRTGGRRVVDVGRLPVGRPLPWPTSAISTGSSSVVGMSTGSSALESSFSCVGVVGASAPADGDHKPCCPGSGWLCRPDSPA